MQLITHKVYYSSRLCSHLISYSYRPNNLIIFLFLIQLNLLATSHLVMDVVAQTLELDQQHHGGKRKEKVGGARHLGLVERAVYCNIS